MAIFISHIWASLCKETSPRLCPFIPELKLWIFWAPIFIIETVYGASVFLILLGLIVAYRKARRLL
jgi:hypothetical protein